MVARPLYKGLIAVLLAWHRGWEALFPREQGDFGDLTILIKTFERPRELHRLVQSIRRRYPAIRILVVDDSRHPADLPDCQVLRLPFDSGVCVGRNAGVAAIETEFFLLLDDDLVFSASVRLGEYLQVIKNHPEIDILGGRLVDVPLYTEQPFERGPLGPTDAQPLIPLGTRFGPAVVVDKVQNYFLGRTDRVRRVPWDPDYAMREHTRFFTDARGKLVTAFHPKMRILHVRDHFDLHYFAYRWRDPKKAAEERKARLEARSGDSSGVS